MTRRFDVGPILVALAALVLLVSLFLDWYGQLTAWEAFEVTEVLLAALALGALAAAFGQLAPELAYVERRWLPALVLAIAVLVAAEIIDPPPAAGPELPSTGAWLAFASALVMLIGTVLSFGRVSFAISVEGKETRERVAVVDHRQDTTETAAVPPDATPRRSMWRGSVAEPATPDRGAAESAAGGAPAGAGHAPASGGHDPGSAPAGGGGPADGGEAAAEAKRGRSTGGTETGGRDATTGDDGAERSAD